VVRHAPIYDWPSRVQAVNSTATSSQRLRAPLAAWAGTVGPVLFFGVVAVEGLLRPGFRPLQHTISDLSRGPRGWIQDANFLVFGILLVIFARGITASINDSRASRIGGRLLLAIGLGALGCGLFRAEPWPPSAMSPAGLLHLVSAMVLVFPVLPVAAGVMARAFVADARWRSLARMTSVTAVATALLLVGGLAVMSPPGQPARIGNHYAGLIQRLDVAVFLAWQFTVSRRMARLQASSKTERLVA
jgi:hypothetical membrane protein